MAVGQLSWAGVLDVPALNAVCERLEAAEVARSRAYAAQLGEVLELQRLLAAAGMGLSSATDLALALRCSETRAGVLLEQAEVLSGLPDGFGVLAEGLLTVEQVAVFVAETRRLTDDDPSGELLAGVWRRLLAELRAALACGWALPPARLTTLLRRWVLQSAPLTAVERRRRAEADGRLEVRRRDDGLVDIFAFGVTAPNAHACLSRIAVRSAPIGLDDDRTADKRRLDAWVELVTGRGQLLIPGVDTDSPAGSGCAAGAGCSCPVGVPVPCGADVQVLVPIGAALGTTDELAELVGSGPLDPDLLRQLLLAAPRLRAVWVDEHGVPVATASRTQTPRRGDPADVRAQLLALAAQEPPAPEPRHPDDHPPGPDTGRTAPPPRSSPLSSGPPASSSMPAGSCNGVRGGPLPVLGAPPGPRPRGAGPHLLGAGPYQVGDRLRRLLTVRRPLCEWPGCGMPARRCDMEHDRAWPAGPTCSCNLGPCCRRHHRVKQLGWIKTRTATAVIWTGPTGRSWTSPSPHQPPARPVRPLPALPADDPDEPDSRIQWENELHPDDPRLDDLGESTFCDDTEPAPTDDPFRERLRWGDTTWTLDLDDVQAWQDIPHTADLV